MAKQTKSDKSKRAKALLAKAARAVLDRAPFTDAAKLSDSDLPDPPSFSEVSEPKKRLYLQALALNGPQYGQAAKAAGVCPATGYNWRHDFEDLAFQDSLMVALKLGIEAAESEFYRRGFRGYKKPVYHQGRLVGTLREFDTTAGIFWLKGNVREKYGDRIEHSGPGGGPIESRSLVATLSTEELVERMRQAGEIVGQARQAALGAAIVPEVGVTTAPTLEAAYAAVLKARQGNGNGGGNGHGA